MIWLPGETIITMMILLTVVDKGDSAVLLGITTVG